MSSSTEQPAGSRYLLDNHDTCIRKHPDITTMIETYDGPRGRVAEPIAPDGHGFYVFDQPGA